MSARNKDQLYDVRCVERNIRKGLLKREDYKKYLKGLRDSTERAVDLGGHGDQGSH
jgi:hypothetical protein